MRTYFLEIWKTRYMNVGICIFSKIMEFDLKCVHMARYELILKLDGALWLTIIFKPLLTPKRVFTIQFEYYFWIRSCHCMFLVQGAFRNDVEP